MRRLCLFVFAILAPIGAALADGAAPADDTSHAPTSRPNSVLLFAGRLSTTDLASTMLFNLRYTPTQGKPSFDNDIVGLEYERDLLEVAHDVRLRAEGGVAERYGHYLVCCLQVPDNVPHPDLTQRLNGRVYSTEAWLGGKIRWENFHLGHGIRLEIAGTIGLSGVTRTIGRERQREIDDGGNAHVQGYIAPELGVSIDSLPNFELVVRMPHRSGAAGTFGRMREAYNADVVGVRYYF